jgi:hypothetical protein
MLADVKWVAGLNQEDLTLLESEQLTPVTHKDETGLGNWQHQPFNEPTGWLAKKRVKRNVNKLNNQIVNNRDVKNDEGEGSGDVDDGLPRRPRRQTRDATTVRIQGKQMEMKERLNVKLSKRNVNKLNNQIVNNRDVVHRDVENGDVDEGSGDVDDANTVWIQRKQVEMKETLNVKLHLSLWRTGPPHNDIIEAASPLHPSGQVGYRIMRRI